MKIFLDFGKTIAETHEGKIVGSNPGCFRVVKLLIDSGHDVVFNTLRVGYEDAGDYNEAFEYLLKNEIRVGIDIGLSNKKLPPERFSLDEEIMFIDDKAEGIPLRKCRHSDANMVNWYILNNMFKDKNIY